MTDWVTTLVYVPTLAGVLLVADEALRACITQELAAHAAFRAARAAASSVDERGHVTGEIDARVRRAAAVTLLPDGDFVREPGRPDPATAGSVADLARARGVALPRYGEPGAALEVEVRDDAGGRIRSGATWTGGPLHVHVSWAHPVRSSPIAWVFADGALGGRHVMNVEASATLWVDGPRSSR